MKKVYYISSIISCLFIIITIFAISCGGGGGDGGGGGSPSISYSGLTIQATVSQSNATDISQGAFTGGGTGASMGASLAGTASQENKGGNDRPLPFRLPMMLENSLSKVNLSSGKIIVGTIKNAQGSAPGNCGGSGDYNINVDDQTGVFNGQIVFHNLCEDNVIMSGGISISGVYDLNTKKFTAFNFDFQNVTFSEGSLTGILKGSLNCSVSGSTVTIAENLLVKTNADNKVHWFNSYSITITKGSNYIDVTGSGTYYHPDHGYVTISSATPLRLYNTDTEPSSGFIKCTGNNNTSVLFTCLSSTTYQIQADTNGDLVYEWDSGVMTW